jgi:hypothetical protein
MTKTLKRVEFEVEETINCEEVGEKEGVENAIGHTGFVRLNARSRRGCSI